MNCKFSDLICHHAEHSLSEMNYDPSVEIQFYDFGDVGERYISMQDMIDPYTEDIYLDGRNSNYDNLTLEFLSTCSKGTRFVSISDPMNSNFQTAAWINQA